jgi:transcription antitermination factor NusG
MPGPDDPTGFRTADEPPAAVDVERAVSDQLRVASGALEGFTGTVIGIRPAAGRLVVRVLVFGRETDVELRYGEVTATGS